MELIKKYWKEGIIVILLIAFSVIYFTNKNKEQELTQEQLEQLQIRNKVENLINAQTEYNKILEEKKAALEKTADELKALEDAVSTSVEVQKKEAVALKNKTQKLNEKYKVNSAYDTTKLTKLLQLYTK